MSLTALATVLLLLVGVFSEDYKPTYSCSVDCFQLDTKDQSLCLFDKIECDVKTTWGKCVDESLLYEWLTIDEWCTKERFECYVKCNDGVDGLITKDKEDYEMCQFIEGC